MTTITVTAIHPKAITLSWTNVTTYNGGDPVVFYGVWCDFGTGSFTQLNSVTEGFYLTYTHTSATVFQANTVFTYRVIPMNGVGNGTYGSVTTTTNNVPISMNSPTLAGTVLYNSIPLSWAALTDPVQTGGDPVIYYEVRYKPCSTCTYTALTTLSQGLFLTYTYTLSSGAFPNGTTVYFTVCAQNGVGMGACASDYGVATCSTPLSMNTPILAGTVLYNQIQISWTGISLASATGGSPVTYYEVRYKSSASGTYAPLTTPSIGVTYSYTHTLASGTFPNGGTVYYIICA